MVKYNCECCEEAVAELLTYKELFTTVVLQQDHEAACFRVTTVANLITDEFLCKCNVFGKFYFKQILLHAKATNSTTNGTKSIAKTCTTVYIQL